MQLVSRHMDMMFCDDKNTTVNRRASGNLSIMKKMSLSLYKMMKTLDNSKTLSYIRRGFTWGYDDILERMLCSCDSSPRFLTTCIESRGPVSILELSNLGVLSCPK